MNRDHMLGWPPAALTLDDPPIEPRPIRTYHRRPAATATSVPVVRSRLSQAEQIQRAARDRNATAMLDTQVPAPVTAKEYPSVPPEIWARELERQFNEFCGTTQVTQGAAQPEPWVYCMSPSNKTIVHRYRGDDVEYADPVVPRWRTSTWTRERVRTFPVVERPSWDPDLAAAPTHTTEYRVRRMDPHHAEVAAGSADDRLARAGPRPRRTRDGHARRGPQPLTPTHQGEPS